MSVYLIAYGIWRFLIEYLRTDFRGGAGIFSPSQWQSFIFIGIGVAILVFYKIKKIPFRLPKEDKQLNTEENKE
jgi:prolipoprotein diacylglyceryltransferase